MIAFSVDKDVYPLHCLRLICKSNHNRDNNALLNSNEYDYPGCIDFSLEIKFAIGP